MKGERKYKILESQKTDEPTWTDKPATQVDLIRAFSWYNINKNNDAAAKYLGVTNPKLVGGYQTLAWSKRMVSRGCIMPEKEAASARRMEEEFKALVKKHEKPVQTDKKVVNIQELIVAKADSFIGELEGIIDDYGIKGKAKDFDAYKWMQEAGVKSVHVPFIVMHFQKQAIEPISAAEGKDAELAEAYSTYSKARLMNLLACYAKIVSDANKFNQNTKVARKPRKKKPVSVTKKVSKLNYMKQEPKLKLQSVEPSKIVGASQLWVYNVKTRKLGIYMSSAANGLDIKGSTIVGYGEASSIAKTLRKPEKVLSEVLSGGKITLRKVMDGINSKPSNLNGRINKDTILLRVV